MSFELLAVITLIALAVGDLIVGVVNDAVNFLNSAIGAKVASRKAIMIVAAIGIIIGCTFSDGIIEVARKGIFHPEFFTGSEAIILFTAVAIADIILLDLYSTFGLPTSTTVSIVFELLGAAFLLAWWKIGDAESAWSVINNASAMRIILGILLSIAISFTVGLLGMFFTRLIFTFDYKEKFKKWGFLWCGVALTALIFFILLKGSKHATFMTSDIKEWIKNSTSLIIWSSLIVFSALSWFLIKARVNILKWVVLIGTGSLAMAFAGNDLANFIGVSVAGTHAYLGAELADKLSTPTWVVLIAGIIMVASIFKSKKAQTVTDTSVNLTSHKKNVMEHWKANIFAEKLTGIICFIWSGIKFPIPSTARKWIAGRWKIDSEHEGHYDLLRASVNLMVAAAVISYATSKKLPLSTTYVTFMVAMGASLADKAWGKECAPCRINGVITVIGGWFVTAVMAFVMSAITVTVLFHLKSYGLVLLIISVAVIVYKLFHLHDKRNGKKMSS